MPKSCTKLRRKSTETELSNHMFIDGFTIEFQPTTSHIKDKEVRKRTMKTRFLIKIHSYQLDETIKNLKKRRIRHIKIIPSSIDLPKECPECKKTGSPIITEERRAKVGNLDFKGNLKKNLKNERWLRYNHKDGKHCRIGKYKIIKIISKIGTIKEGPYIELKKSLEKYSLGYSRSGLTEILSSSL